MPRRTVYFAKITRGPQVTIADRGPFKEAMLTALDPRHTVERYGRTWRFSRPVEEGDYIFGKLGFTHEGEEERTEYDEEEQDFVTTLGPATQAFFSHFVIDSALEVVAFETKGRVIRLQSFLGAFEGLLDAAGFDGTTVEALTDPASLREWARTVDRVVRIRAVVMNPNPGWVEDAGAMRQLVEETDATSAEVTVKAAPGEGLNTGAPWVGGALHQVGDEGQGSIAAVGVRGDRESRWTSGQRLRTASLDEDSTDESEDIWGDLRGLLREAYDR